MFLSKIMKIVKQEYIATASMMLEYNDGEMDRIRSNEFQLKATYCTLKIVGVS